MAALLYSLCAPPSSSSSSSSSSLVISSRLRRPRPLLHLNGVAAVLTRRKIPLIVRAQQSPSPSPPAAISANDGKEIVPDSQLSFGKISLGNVALTLGVSLLGYGFGAYFNIWPGSEWSALMLTYGFPLAIIGMALKYAELTPVECITYVDALALREVGATPTLKQVKADVTRFRYGDEQHLEEALKRIFRYGQAGGISRRYAPVLQLIREEVSDSGKYTLTLVFEGKALNIKDFEDRKAKFTSFFGPGVMAEIGPGGENLYEVRLVADGMQS